MAEDKTLNSLRILSQKKASINQGSIVTQGGIYVKGNIECEDKLVVDTLIVRGTTKLAGDVSIGGEIIYPQMNNWENGDCNCTLPSINTHSISTKCINTPSIHIEPGQINVHDNINIIDPKTGVIMARSFEGRVENYIPIYSQWMNIRSVQIIYDPEIILKITTSFIFIIVPHPCCLNLVYDACLVPDNTMITTYFINNNRRIKLPYNLNIGKYKFASETPTKNIKLAFLEGCINLL